MFRIGKRQLWKQSVTRVLMQRLKEEKEGRRARLDGRHDYLFAIVASCVDLNKTAVEDAILEGNQIERIDQLFAVGGLRHLMFYYQDVEVAETEQLDSSGGVNPVSGKMKKPKVFVTEGKDVALTGICVFFIRTDTSRAITPENIHREVSFNMLDAANGGLLNSVRCLLSDIFIPALRATSHGWGELEGLLEASSIRQEFLSSLEGFVSILSGAQESLKEKVNLQKCDIFELKTLKEPIDYLTLANNPETLEKIEGCMKVWIKQTEQVLAENNQLRKEADDLGPRAELEHWKKRLSKFNYLLEQLKGPEVKAVLAVLAAAKSKLLKTWREMDVRITDAANEAKDNVKYLYTLEKCCDPLYSSDPVSMIDAIPTLINAIKMIYSISHYYNTSEKITSLFVKVTNQMISACKAYITNNGTASLWSQPQDVVVEKILSAIKLKQEYQHCFHKTKQKLKQDPNEKQFEFSEMYIFGKFETFHRRLAKIIDIFTTFKTYSVLQDSKIEGLEDMVTKYQDIVATIKKKEYNFLDQRKMDFDQDYEEFCKQTNDLHNELRKFMDATFEKIPNTNQALSMLKKFERLNIPNLGTDDKYRRILENYGADIDMISKLYTKQKCDPPLARDQPPIAGKILWARQLFHRVQQPMQRFQQHPTVLQTVEAKPVIRSYNRLARVLLEFEVLYHRAWLQQNEDIHIGLEASLLVKAPGTGELFVNFDPQILTLFRETECMSQMGLEVSPFAAALFQKRDIYKKNFSNMKMMLAEYQRVKSKMPPTLEQLMIPHLAQVDKALQPGLAALTWTSLNIQTYLKNAFAKIKDLELLLDRVNDWIEFRIDAVLEEMSLTLLCQLPQEEPLSCEEFLQMTTDLCVNGAQILHCKSSLVEEAVNELINMLLDVEVPSKEESEKVSNVNGADSRNEGSAKREGNPDSLTSSLTAGASLLPVMTITRKKKETEMLEEEARELLSHFNHQNVDALLKVTRNTLEAIRRRIHASNTINFRDSNSASPMKPNSRPIFRAGVTLVIPNIAMTPALEDVQQTLNKAVECVINVTKGVRQWSGELSPTKKIHERKRAALQNGEDSGSDAEVGEKEPQDTFEVASVNLPIPVQTRNYYKNVSDNKEIVKLVSVLGTIINSTKKEVITAMDCFKRYNHIWQKEKEETTMTFILKNPLLSEFKSQILYFQNLQQEINAEPEYICVGAIALYTADLKFTLTAETKAWMVVIGRHCNRKYRSEMETIFTLVEEFNKKLNRPIRDLDDIRIAMAALKELREQQIPIDFQVGPIEESYALLNKHGLLIAKEEMDKVDTLRYAWEKLLARASEVQNELISLQPGFRKELISTMEIFLQECRHFYVDYDLNGPMASGLKPQEASDKLVMFQNQFDNIYRKYITYTGGEELFGLPVTQYPQLLEIKKQLNLLQKIYTLYNSVIETVNNYHDILWSEVNIEKITSELLEFQNRCRKLPRASKDWQAFLDLKRTIEDFSECCPLLEHMGNKAMTDRHWERIAALTGHSLDVRNETFKLRNIMEIPLLKYKEEIEDICVSAVKERDIEQKLKQVVHEWDNKTLTFGSFKTRGELLLRGDSTSEIIANMEDSLMLLGSLLSNRKILWLSVGGGIEGGMETSVESDCKIYDRILSVSSREGETIELDKPVMAEGNVEVWLNSLLEESRSSLHLVIRQAAENIQETGFQLIEFLSSFPAQVGLLGVQMIWTRDSEEALRNAKFDKKIMQKTNQSFLELLNTLIDITTKDLSSMERVKYETLITIHVHQRDIFDDLCHMHIKSPTDFEWLKQCRFYFNEDSDKMMIHITDVAFIYQNEFLGCTDRLVITPLTDRCYITLAQALGMSMGGAPAGPAGTGKTETTKDMGRCLGKYVVVFNCSDQMDFRGLGRIFKGLAQSGSWGCFDEFNRIDLPVLSVAAQQISIILTCKKEHKISFIFTDGDNVTMNPEFGLFLTMNPGYAGRQELPENLKINFRSVAMMVPDRQIIIRVKLASCGFIDNIVLARKFFTLYKLCEEQLSKQVHYDFGLRNILSVLRTLGSAKRTNPTDTESTIVMRVLRDMNLSKLIDEDEPLFLSLIEDLFPNILLDKAGYPELEAAISRQVEEAGLINHPPWRLKVIQLFETQRVRHGMMTLGPSGAGKTTCIHTLMKAMTDCGKPHREMRMNPKAITAPQMFGRLDVATNDWTDGVFSTLWRKTLKAKKGEHIWIVLDGPVDAIWIENLNSVLDDNKTLTLANGDRIPMAPNCKIVFEPHNIDNASPATVSRNGMVFMSSSILDWSPILERHGKWVHWNMCTEEYEYPSDSIPEYSSILVPNVDNVRTDFLIKTIAKQGKAVLLIGEQGTAKTVIIKGFMSKYDPESHMIKSLNFSSATTPLMFQRTIESYVDKRMGTTYGPPAGKKMTVFIDDVNMPIINEWGDQVTNEIVRQLMEQNGFYNLEKPGEFTSIVDIQVLAAMIHPGGGRNDIPQRLKRQFSIFNCTLPSDASMDKIFGVIGIGYYCAQRGFSKEVRDSVRKLVPLTRRLWQVTKAKMLPTPAKFHYVFNLRDLSRIWQGMLKTTSEVIKKPDELLRLWKHECKRVIADRFTVSDDVTWFDKALVSLVEEEFGDEKKPLVDCGVDAYFVDFLRDAPEATGETSEEADGEMPKVYESVQSFDHLKERLNMFLQLYNESIRGAGMDLVFFVDAMVHLVKISRIIRTPRGNALLVGVGGSGKQSLTRLASFIAGYTSFQITLTRSYNTSNLMEDLKILYKTAGQQGKGITFIFTDNEIKDEAFLEYMNNVLSSGEVSSLFARDEMDEINSELMPVMKKEHPRRPPTNENLHDYFMSRVRQHLHTVLCFSPVGEKFRNRALKFPALISGCTIDWFSRWPKDALVAAFAEKLPVDILSDKDTEQFPKDTINEEVIEFLNPYFEMADYNIETAKRVCGNVAGLCSWTKAMASFFSINREVLPLKTIKPSDIATVRTLGRPPHLIMRIMDCVLLLFQRKVNAVKIDLEKSCTIPSWQESLKLMTAGNFLQNLQWPISSSKNDVAECGLWKSYTVACHYMSIVLLPYRMNTGLKKLKEASESVAALSKELEVKEKELQVANDKADMFLKEVTMKAQAAEKVKAEVQKVKDKAQAIVDGISKDKAIAEEKLEAAQPALEEAEAALQANLVVQENRHVLAMQDLQKAQEELDAKQTELDVVQAEYEQAMSEKQTLLEDAERCRFNMCTITRLIIKNFGCVLFSFSGDVLLATAFLSYSGPFNQEFRNLLLNDWQKEMKARKIPFGDSLNLTEMLIDAPTISEWNLQGLPNDDLSIQNGIIVTKASRYPLLIDPQTQGKIWIKNKESQNELQITSLNHKYFRNHLEDSLSLGRPLLIEDVGQELDPALDNVLERNFIKTGSTFKVKVGDKEELEKERTHLMEDVTANKRRMKELEDNLLYRLTSTQGSLVEEEGLIVVLSNTKKTAEEVTQKLEISAETEIQINSAREEYRPVATRGSILYFLVTEMRLVNEMYQTSLRQFLGLFDLSLARSVKSPITSKRIANIIEHMTYEVYKYAARGLYEEHKFLFTLLLTLKIDLQRNRLKHEEFLTLIKGGASLDLKACPPKPSKWILDMTWLNLVELSKLRQFSDVLDQISRNEKMWKIWFDKENPEEEPLPNAYDKSLDCFRRLLLIRSWCPDRTMAQARKYIKDSMGESYVEGVILDLERTWEESDPRTPLICLLSMGSDPTDSIIALGKRLKIETRYVSMGQGQEVHARKLLQQTMANGGWVLLQNCHLGLDFMDELMDIIVETEMVHDAFRLWVTTEAHKQFPITLLQMSIKFTNEPPQGLRAGLKRTYGGVSQDLLDMSTLVQWKPMLYAVAFLHSTVQERRKFGPLGWNIPYEFNQADFNATVQFIQNHLDDMDIKKGVSWTTVRYMIGEIQYGGRVTDDYDKRLLNTFAKVWFSENMFGSDFSFYQGYNIPKCSTVDNYLHYIQSLPTYDSPEVFGLHPNADITYQSKLAKDVLDIILGIQPKDSSGGGDETREAVVARLADDMLEKLPPDYSPFEVKERLQKMGPFQPMNIFLRQEIDRMQRVLTLVRSTLTELKLAIDGTIIMSENLRDALNCMFDARIPARWKKASWVSSTLGFWFTELIERNCQFTSWVFNGRPHCFWMTGFFNPQGFLTAMRQEITRANKGCALDNMVLCNEVTKWMKDDISAPPTEGVYVYGLYLEGAGWDKRNMKLIESKPKVLFELMPVIRIYAENNTLRDPRFYSCPIYKKPVRTDLNYIADVDLRTAQDPDHWVLRGVALLCDVK
ncbi:PREDICTED: dynein heavy chain 5, axonemal [Hipposideros armiger]|uniref:Dynein heavy chain 5, axonemal n=1 Tax=Hipposideros armiger TaxID=186990 RepID=A0A8B7RRG6_HIPAR|nr:PREDICTED: dynein heavy chain 5, axonemal [Hipposideros armiger]